jgi:amino acid permease
MKKKYSFWERISGDTPSFFKKVQILGAGLVAISVSLTGVGIIPVAVTGIIAAVGTTMGAIAQLAVKQSEPDTTASEK